MKALILTGISSLLLLLTASRPSIDQAVDLSEIGITFTLPDTWRQNGPMLKQTWSDYYLASGQEGDHPDGDELVFGFNTYIHHYVDSTLLPAPEAYRMHFLTIRMEGYYSWFRRWLWSMGKRSLWEDIPVVTRAGVEILKQEVLAGDDPRNVIDGAYGIEYEIMPETAIVPTKGRMFFVTRGTRCYLIALESDLIHYEEYRPTHDAVLRSMAFVD